MGRNRPANMLARWFAHTSAVGVAGLLVVLAFAVTDVAFAGLADTRIEGQYKIVYTPLNQAGYTNQRRWTVTPKCQTGACALRVVSRPAVKATPSRRFTAEYDGRRYSALGRGKASCILSDGSELAGGYTSIIVVHFRVTRQAPDGTALTFQGTQIERFTPTTKGIRNACGPTLNSRSRLTAHQQ